ncbi:UDP-galactopyranose mutase, partial [Alphaproteobacteria bacterium]|nr:UDP-galactopyranose mutase [Alphaproteobacteria bacterium]
GSIINRVKVREDDNELYFPNDKFQMLPTDGYSALFESIFSHPNIKLELNISFSKQMEKEYDHVFNAMPIDVYYDFQFGELPYRSVIFEHSEINIPRVFNYPTINFTNDGPYTRVTEWKNYPMHGANNHTSVLTFEKPVGYKENNFERYYPVKDIDGNIGIRNIDQ